MNEDLKEQTKEHFNGFTGFCLYCNNPISKIKFCSPECEEDFELASKIGLIRGFNKH